MSSGVLSFFGVRWGRECSRSQLALTGRYAHEVLIGVINNHVEPPVDGEVGQGHLAGVSPRGEKERLVIRNRLLVELGKLG